jgi:hypothetical protein
MPGADCVTAAAGRDTEAIAGRLIDTDSLAAGSLVIGPEVVGAAPFRGWPLRG